MNIYKLKTFFYDRSKNKPKSSITLHFINEELAYEFLVRKYPRVKESGMTGYKPNQMGYAVGDKVYRFSVQQVKLFDQKAMDKLFQSGAGNMEH